ncbi:ammonium transporter Rh type B-like [Scleropages formosus]|uniref:Ammonium transporter Rh type B-like n=1 Tax=Scleropages formosus TaxID=113540 RepID=A0A0P7UWE0_SCLFO|nr:ammonium transporter Rh type B-like [Scleropages formosus]
MESCQRGVLGLASLLGLPGSSSPTFDPQGEHHALVLEAVDELAAVLPVVLELQVHEAQRRVQRVRAPQGRSARQRSVRLVRVAVGDEHHVLEAARQRLHFGPPHFVVRRPGAQQTRQSGVRQVRSSTTAAADCMADGSDGPQELDSGGALPITCIVMEVIVIILFAVFVRYDTDTDARKWHKEKSHDNKSNYENDFYFRYPSFQDVHVMIFIGFGFLMTFLQRYGFSSVGFNFLIAAFSLQWATLMQGFFHGMHNGKIEIGVESMINADFCTGAVLISFGAVLGKTSPVQLLIMAVIEVTLFAINEFLVLSVLNVSEQARDPAKDAGGSMTIHIFGAYFGLGVTRVLYRPNLDKSQHKNCSVYHSDLFAMIGKLHPLRIFLVCSVHIQNAALAGGVAMGTAGEMMLTPVGSMVVGFLAGIISTLGFKYLTPILEEKFHVQDTCGVHNLHGMPGVLGATVGTITASLASAEVYGEGMKDVFPDIYEGKTTPFKQAMWQGLSMGVTMGIASIGGILTGLLLKVPIYATPPDTMCFEDNIYWEVPGEEDSHQELAAVRTEEVEKPLNG